MENRVIFEDEAENVDYITFNVYTKGYFKDNNIEMSDLNSLSDADFKNKYNTTKNDLHAKIVKEYKLNHPEDYEKHLAEFHKIQRVKIVERKKNYEKFVEKRKKDILEIVLRQTDYTKDKAIEELEKEEYNYMNVLQNYMDPDYKKKRDEAERNKESKTLNQKIYTEIRNFMDSGVNK